MKTQLDGQKALHLSLLLWPSSTPFFFNNSLIFLVCVTSIGLLVILMHVLQQGHVRKTKRENGGSRQRYNKCDMFFFPFFLPLFRSFNLRPQRTSTWPGYLADSENNKKDFLGLTSISYSQAEWERKIQIQTGRRQRLVLKLYLFRFLSGSLTYYQSPFLLSLTFHLSCRGVYKQENHLHYSSTPIV